MYKEQLAKLVAEKIDAAKASGEHPKKFFITANGRGVTDGGDLYNALLADVLGVVKVAIVDILQEVIPASIPAPPAPTPPPKAEPAPAPAAKLEKPAKGSKK